MKNRIKKTILFVYTIITIPALYGQINFDSNFIYQSNKSLQKFTELNSKILPVLGETNILFNSGNVNSWYNDYQINGNQIITNPYQSIRLKDFKRAEMQSQLTEIELNNFALSRDWYLEIIEFAYLSEQIKIGEELLKSIETADSIFNTRIELGLNSNIERLSLNLLKGRLILKLQQLYSKSIDSKQKLYYLKPDLKDLPNSKLLYDLDFINERILPSEKSITIKLHENKLEEISFDLKYQTSIKFPNLQVGYTQQSFQGFQTINNKETFFTKNTPFYSFQVGLSAPLFLTGQQNHIKSLKYKVKSEEQKLRAVKYGAELKTNACQEQLKLSAALLKNQIPQLLKLLEITRESLLIQLNQNNLDPIEISRIIDQQTELNWAVNEAFYIHQLNTINQLINQ